MKITLTDITRSFGENFIPTILLTTDSVSFYRHTKGALK